jgi:hypothetical protein
MRKELSFRTYKECSPDVPGESVAEFCARNEKERAMRYMDQANTALRLAKEALVRAHRYSSRAPRNRVRAGE